ncbi:hypothetical protein MBANPS3_002071 [Mucor bainieri]
MASAKRKQEATGSQSAPVINKRACLANKLSGNTIPTQEFATKLSAPSFIASLEARRHWKMKSALVKSYFEHTDMPKNSPIELLTVLNGSKQVFDQEYKKAFNEHQINALERNAEYEARTTSRILTTVEAQTHRMQMQQRLDGLDNEEEDDTEPTQTQEATVLTNDEL